MLRFILITLLAIIVSAQDMYASHALGAELTYECLGNNMYRIRLAFYYDCNGAVSAPSAAEVNINSSCFNAQIDLIQLPAAVPQPPFDQYLGPNEIPIYCEASNCTNGSLPGIKEYIYVDTIQLPPCNNYIISFAEGNRSAAIQTVVDPEDEEIYVEAFLNSVEAPCNSSPKFDLPARGFLCANQDNSMVQTASDIDGDVIVYSLYAPLVDANSAVNYINPYTYLNPIQNNYLNFVDGVINIWPTEQVVTVMGVMVEEYRNGVLIGSVMRDMQVRVVANCPQNPVGLFEYNGITGFEPDSVFLCSNDTFELDIFLDSTLVNQNYTILSNNIGDFAGATFELEPDPNNPGSVIGHFEWSPDYGNLNTQTLVFTAFDDNCPIVGYRSFTFRFYFQNIIADATTDSVGVACNDDVTLTVDLDQGIPPFTYEWQDASSQTTFPADDVGIYWVQVTDSAGCNGTDTFNVFVDNYPLADFTVNDVCDETQLDVDNLSINYAYPGVTPLQLTGWNWDFGDGTGMSTDENPIYTYQEPGDYTISLILQNENDCYDTIEVDVTVNPVPVLDVSADDVCDIETSQFENNTQIATGSITSWEWDFGDGTPTSSAMAPQHAYADTGDYVVTLTAISDLGCEKDTTIVARVVQRATAAFSYETDVQCDHQNLRVFLTNESENAVSYLWDFGSSTDTTTNPIYDSPDGVGPNITLYANANSAVCSDSVTVDITNIWLGVDFDSIPVGNVITPNADGFNDCLAPYYDESYAECYTLKVWDRWGGLVYDSEKAGPEGFCWYGTRQKGRKLATGVYFFVAEVNNYKKSGSVTLVD